MFFGENDVFKWMVIIALVLGVFGAYGLHEYRENVDEYTENIQYYQERINDLNGERYSGNGRYGNYGLAYSYETNDSKHKIWDYQKELRRSKEMAWIGGISCVYAIVMSIVCPIRWKKDEELLKNKEVETSD